MSSLLVWSATSPRADLTGGDSTAYLRKQLVNIAIGLVLLAMVTATDHRWVRIVAPLRLPRLGRRPGPRARRWARRSTARSRGCGSAASPSSPRSSPSSRSWSAWRSCVAERSEGRRRAVRRRRRRLAHAARRRGPGRPDPAAARPRHDARPQRHRVRRARGVRRPPPLAVRSSSAAPSGRPPPRSRPASSRPTRSTASSPSSTPSLDPRGAGYNVEQARIAIGNGGSVRPGTLRRLPDPRRVRPRAADRLRLHRRGGGARPGRRRCPDRLALPWSSGAPWSSPDAPTTSSAGSARPASPAGSASRRSRTSACAWASCPSPASPCRSSPTADRRCSPGLLAVGLLQNIHLRSRTRSGRSAYDVNTERRVLAGR